MAERTLVMVLVVGLGLEAWRGWGQTPGVALPHPSLFTAFVVVIVLLGILATFAPALAAVLAVGVLLALILGVRNPLAKAAANG
jgi:hypothetical protein